MAKDIKAIQCPHCGSVFKEEFKPDFYRCKNCGTEYYLDSDDVHIYHHQERYPINQSSAPPVNPKLPVFILVGAVLFIVVVYFVSMLFQHRTTNNYSASTIYKTPRMYYSSFVYTNTVTGDPVYLRLGTDYIDKGDNKSAQELHAQFNNAVNGKLIADRIMTDIEQGSDRCTLTFKTYSPTAIYAIGCSKMLLMLDTRNDKLIDVTKSMFKDYPQLSSGVARLDFDYNKDMINVMNNEGKSFHYFPVIKKLVDTDEQAEAIWKQRNDDQHYFEFGYLDDYFDKNKQNQLLEMMYSKEAKQMLRRDLTPGRKYFEPKILYQDNDNLLIVVNTTAAADPPVSIQKIDIKAGKLQWALPPDSYYLYAVAKCKQGFAVEYRKGSEADYVHGVLVVSPQGNIVYNYKLSRME